MDLYKETEKDIPAYSSEQFDKDIQIHFFVDAIHTADKVTCRSQIGILIFINKAAIMFYSKQ